MPLQSSGPIGLGDVRTELETSGEISLNTPSVRSLLQVPSGTISLNNAYGKIYFNNFVWSGGTGFTHGGYNYRIFSGFDNGSLVINGTKAMEWLLVGGGGGSGFGGGGGGGGGGIKYISNAFWSSTKTSGISYSSSTFFIATNNFYDGAFGSEYAGGFGADDYRELTDAQWDAAYFGNSVSDPGAPATISSSGTRNGNIAFAAGGGAGGTYYTGGNGGTSTNYFRNGLAGSVYQYVLFPSTYSTFSRDQANRNSIFRLSQRMSTSPSAGLGESSCGGGAFGSSTSYTGGGPSGKAGQNGSGGSSWGGGGGGGLGGDAIAGSRFSNGGHGGPPIQLAAGWVTNSSGSRPFVGGGGAGGGRADRTESGGYTYSTSGSIAYSSYPNSNYPTSVAPPPRGGRTQSGGQGDFHWGDYGYFDYYGFGGCGGASGTTVNNGSGNDTRRDGGSGMNGLIIARWL